MTLFELAAPSNAAFASALEKYFAGKRDARSRELIRIAGKQAQRAIKNGEKT
jgi:uncharacterized protein (DUF1810 family)